MKKLIKIKLINELMLEVSGRLESSLVMGWHRHPTDAPSAGPLLRNDVFTFT